MNRQKLQLITIVPQLNYNLNKIPEPQYYWLPLISHVFLQLVEVLFPKQQKGLDQSTAPDGRLAPVFYSTNGNLIDF